MNLRKIINPETYEKYILPLGGIAESIATDGKSPGTAALAQQKIFRDARSNAMQKRLQEAQLVGYETENKSKTADAERKARQEARAQKMRYEIGALKEQGLSTEDYQAGLQGLAEKYAVESDPDKFLSYLASMAKTKKTESKESSKIARELRKEKNQSGVVKDFQDIERAWKGISTVWPPAKATSGKEADKRRAAVDQALITLYNKMLDPTSVVRESEYARTPDNAPAVNRFMGRMQAWVTGGAGLTDADRQEIFDVAQKLYASSTKQYRNHLETYRLDAEEEEIPLERIFSVEELRLLKGEIPGMGTAKGSIQEEKAPWE